jgi:hypothetical protein
MTLLSLLFISFKLFSEMSYQRRLNALFETKRERRERLETEERGGTRGGRDRFDWDSVKNDKYRLNYLGNSVHASVGRWQQCTRDTFFFLHLYITLYLLSLSIFLSLFLTCNFFLFLSLSISLSIYLPISIFLFLNLYAAKDIFWWTKDGQRKQEDPNLRHEEVNSVKMKEQQYMNAAL